MMTRQLCESFWPVLVVAAACTGDGAVVDSGGAPVSGQPKMAVVSTSLEGVGALAAIELDSLKVRDELASISSDALVVTEGEFVFQLNRSDFDSVRVYEHGRWTSPALEIGLPSGSNAWDVEVCEGAMFVALYGSDALAVYDINTGVLSGVVDLSPWDDGDGLPEAANLVEIDGKLYASLQQFDRNAGWTSTSGVVVEVDCARRAVTQSWAVGPSPTISAMPDRDDLLLVRSGVYFEPDGGVGILDVTSGELTENLISEAALELDVTHVVLSADATRGLLLTSDFEWPATYGVWCFSTDDWLPVKLEETDVYISDMSIDERDRAWVSMQAPSWGVEDAEAGIQLFDVVNCERARGEQLQLTLDPGRVAFY